MNYLPLSTSNPVADYELGDSIARYTLRGGHVELSLLPKGRLADVVARRQSGRIHDQLTIKKFREIENTSVDSLVQVAVRGAAAYGAWTNGATMRNNDATQSLRFVGQICRAQEQQVQIQTQLESPLGFTVTHRLLWHQGDPGVQILTEIANTGKEVLPVEMLSSFSLGDITPFAVDDAPNCLRLHRFRSAWSNEANYEAVDLESLSLERTWAGCPASLRYGQTGSLPVRNYHPFIAVEDLQRGVFWGAQIAWHGSWQMEVYRRDDPVHISGGLGDYERAHWMKEIQPGESFAAPVALVACGEGDIDSFCQRLVELQARLAHSEPEHESELPIIFNEWCSTWGSPTHDYLMQTADKLAETETRYLVIDDGWAEKAPNAEFQYNGDWNVNRQAFPGGLHATCTAIRERGLIPGIWFEFEPCTEGTEAFKQTDHQLKRHGQVLQVGNRHFWDFRDPWTHEYLTRKVVDLLRDNHFGYLKVDYNDSIGIGCDGAESLGEGLRQHLEAVRAFFQNIRSELPDLVIENCSSGGHRLEPGMVGLTSMSSSTDAHETVEIPIIIAQLHRLIPAAKNQVWAVLRPDDDLQRLRYSLAATFLGRMCISGDLMDLSEDRLELLKAAQSFYVKLVPILKSGRSRLIDFTLASRRYPEGWQVLLRQSTEDDTLMLVIHSFDLTTSEHPEVCVPLPATHDWELVADFGLPATVQIEGGQLRLPGIDSFMGCACILRPRSQ